MDPNVPETLDDTSWLAVKGGTVDAVIKVMGLSDPKLASWSQGMEVIGGYHGDCPAEWGELAGVFITPLMRGWRLVVGHYTGAAPLSRPADDMRTGWRRVAGWCRRLSREFDKAHAFTEQAQLDWYSWILASGGTVFRQVVYEDGEFLSHRGRPSGLEARLVARFRPDELRPHWQPDVGDVARIAGEWSVNPCRINPRTRTSGSGFVAVTPWGRQQGVTFTGLGNGSRR
jgi:hypothetical protein